MKVKSHESQDTSDKHICQVALCALNAANLRDWYQRCFGMIKGGKIFSVAPMPTDRIQGISPNPTESVSWLVDQQDYFQLEFFQFYRPQSKPRPIDWRPCDTGYNLMGIYAKDFDKILAGIAANSDRAVPEPVGSPGERRVCLRDPEGNWLEILERDPMTQIEGADPCIVRPELACATRFMRVSVPDLETSRGAFVNAMGLTEVEDFQLHTPEHESLWGLDGAQTRAALLRSRNFLVELVEYRSHQPKPRPEAYQICDQGFMNIALGYRETREFDAEFEHAIRNGMTPNGKPVDIGLFRVMYVNDPQGFSVEMLNARKALWSLSGFSPREPYVENEIFIDASAEQTWNKLIEHSCLGDWTIFKGKVLRPGSDSGNGPGCVRELTRPGCRITEEIVSWDEGKHYSYKLRTGAPFKFHQGDVFVSEENGMTRVRWAIRFHSRIPFTGKLIALGMKVIFRDALNNLKKQLESCH
jgi:catechol 2,3-dioxygenase-like lactoylglutathione lyase family enzyme